MSNKSALLAAVLLIAGAARNGRAQSEQVNSIQASATALLLGTHYTVPGGEVQYRWSPPISGLSIGAGMQLFWDPTKVCSSPTSCNKIGGTSVWFVEPRYVVGVVNKNTGIYVAGRAGYAGQGDDGGFVLGGGGGIMQILTKTITLDLGLQGYTSAGTSGVLQTRAGLSFGF